MRVAFVTAYDATDVSEWSGTPFFMLRALMEQGIDVVKVGPLHNPGMLMRNMKRVVYRGILRGKYHWQREPTLLKAYAAQIRDALSHTEVDFVLSPSTMPVSLLDSPVPVAFWTDATFSGMIDFYDSFSNLCRETIVAGNRMEQSALDHCDLAIYSSHWAAETALSGYRVSREKVKVVPYGANLESGLNRDGVLAHVSHRDDATCELLFVGVDWVRKGGNLALGVCERLNRLGVSARITLVGSLPEASLPAYASSEGFVSKANEAGRTRLRDLYLRSHYLILPTQADCVPVVLAEANSFGVPVLTTDVGGIATVVGNGENGWALPLDASADEYVRLILQHRPGSREYSDLAMSSYDRYARDLNWKRAVQSVTEVFKEVRR